MLLLLRYYCYSSAGITHFKPNAFTNAKHAAKANVVDPIPGEDPEFIDLEPVVYLDPVDLIEA